MTRSLPIAAALTCLAVLGAGCGESGSLIAGDTGDASDAGPDPAGEAGAVDQSGCALPPPPQAAATTAASTISATRAGAAGRSDGRRIDGA